ncbi:N-acetylmuramate/N-acetylglucosamine kinase [Frankliniella fusca]|uniref:N-acetylmuramate/N-acetylglucosamine kinase n=1 Tax=Frankliniella fusca TaxID=407009 RepID=A0AAE1I104_9NEOP|nr:N-acetylmuramate/N-acetylglucosamine kinase [Frankliniella fusca]
MTSRTSSTVGASGFAVLHVFPGSTLETEIIFQAWPGKETLGTKFPGCAWERVRKPRLLLGKIYAKPRVLLENDWRARKFQKAPGNPRGYSSTTSSVSTPTKKKEDWPTF